MIDPSNNSLHNTLDSVQPRIGGREQSLVTPASDQPAWFLTHNSVSQHTISAVDDPTLLGASPDAVASRILAHIGG